LGRVSIGAVAGTMVSTLVDNEEEVDGYWDGC